ncbi:MAG: DNA polymerase IV [Pseudohongiellaceae bacterium]
MRKIIHCDCDCFYASIEIRDNPGLEGKPVAVGGSPRRRGVIATCNYVARQQGIHSAMASVTARQRCPELIIVRPDMEKYRVASRQMHDIFRRYTDLIEPLSLDEAYLDVSASQAFQGSATRIARTIRDEVRAHIGITLSAGIAPNKFLAKIASDWNKPDGQFVIEPEAVEAFVAALPVAKLHGVGKVTAARMKRMGIERCADLRAIPESDLRQHFGSFGERLRQLANGIDERPVMTDRIRKSVSVENTYANDLPDLAACLEALPGLGEQLQRRLDSVDEHYLVQKQFVKIKFHDFNQTTVEMIASEPSMENFRTLCEQGYQRRKIPVRLLGVGVRVLPRTAVPEQTPPRTIQLPLELEAF